MTPRVRGLTKCWNEPRTESQAVRQILGHTKLPDFVGGFGTSQYRPER